MLDLLKKPQHRTHTTIDWEDYEYLKKHNLKIAHIVRDFCNKRRAMDSGQYEESIEELKKQKQRVMARLQKVFETLPNFLTEKEMNEFIEKV